MTDPTQVSPGAAPPAPPARARSAARASGPSATGAPEQERAVQEGRQPAQRAGPDPQHLLQARVRLHRPGRPAWPVPLDGPLHPARPGLRRRQDRDARGGGARRRVLHAPGALRRQAAAGLRRAGAGHHRPGLRPRHRRRHRPREHPVPLDPHRGRPADLGAPRRRRAQLARGLRRLAAPVPRLAGRRRGQGRDHRRQPPPWTRSSSASSATRSSPTCRASSRPR